MALSRRRRYEPVNYWPGFVDALSTMLLVIIFLLSVFMLAQFFLSREVTGKDEALTRLNRQIEELTNLLALERTQKGADETRIATLTATLESAEREQKRLKDAAAETAASADAAGTRRGGRERARRREADLRQGARRGRRPQPADRARCASSSPRSRTRSPPPRRPTRSRSRRSPTSASGSTSRSPRRCRSSNRYRSDFFGRLRQILGARPDIRVVGDRFVFESSVLFDVGKADISPEGKQSLDSLAAAVLDLEREIPPDIPWILRVDGHTDSQPISGGGPVQVELGALGRARGRGGAIPRLQGRGAGPARRRGLRRVPADRRRDRRGGDGAQPAHRTEADRAVSASVRLLRGFEAGRPSGALPTSGSRPGARPASPSTSRRAGPGSPSGSAPIARRAARSSSASTPTAGPRASSRSIPASGYLDQLCVAPARAGLGARGRARSTRRSGSPPGAVELDVNEANERARRFYEREGFVARRPRARARSRACRRCACAGRRDADAPLCRCCHDVASRLGLARRRTTPPPHPRRAKRPLLSPGEATHAQDCHSVAGGRRPVGARDAVARRRPRHRRRRPDDRPARLDRRPDEARRGSRGRRDQRGRRRRRHARSRSSSRTTPAIRSRRSRWRT